VERREESLTSERETIRLRTLGRLDLESAARPLAQSLLTGPKRAALLVYLACESRGGFVRRDAILPLLWPDLDQADARHALRNTLSILRKFLGSDAVVSRGKEEIALAEGALWADVAAYEDALAELRYEDAVALYQGEFLDGFHVPGAGPAFEHWLDGIRDRLARDFEKAQDRVATEAHRPGTMREQQAPARAIAVPTAEHPLVGRVEELERINAAGRAAASGQAGVAVIMGVAGIGKTRLAEEFLMRAAAEGFASARGGCFAAEGRLAYGPVTDWLRSEAIATHLHDLEAVRLTELSRVLPELLSERPHLSRPEPLIESWQRRRFFEAVALAVTAMPEPLALLIDDLQWADSGTVQWLRYIMHFRPGARLLVVGTLRDVEIDGEHAWSDLRLALRRSGQLTEIALEPLDREHSTSLAAHVAKRSLTTHQADSVFEETEGNPLFVVEAIRAGLLEREARSGDPSEAAPWLPSKVQAVIEHRLSQLSAMARDAAELAATVGRPFTVGLLAEAARGDEASVAEALDELWQRRIIVELEGQLDFSHDKLREVANAETGPAKKALLHRQIARALETLYAQNLDDLGSRLAAHYEMAGLTDLAISHYERAAEVARHAYADEEAVALLTRAISLLIRLPEGESRDGRELRMQVGLGVAAAASRGWAAEMAGEAFARAADLTPRDAEISPELLTTEWGTFAYHAVRGNLERAAEVAERFLHVAHREEHPEALIVSRFNAALVRFHRGRLSEAHALIEAVAADPHLQRHRVPFVVFPIGVLTLGYRAHIQWHMGDEEGSMESVREARRVAMEPVRDPLAHAALLGYEAMLHCFRNEAEEAHATAEVGLNVCHSYDVPYYGAWVTMVRGWARGMTGEPELGVDEIERGLADHERTGAGLKRPFFLGLLADTIARAGDTRRAWSVLSEAHDTARQTGERWCEPELLRMGAEILRKEGTEADAEDRFHQAIDLARDMGATAVAQRATDELNSAYRRA
jgi:tetratricopeptide (TPR) repeat protein